MHIQSWAECGAGGQKAGAEVHRGKAGAEVRNVIVYSTVLCYGSCVQSFWKELLAWLGSSRSVIW
jgi:hypothetical protein